ncbi:hypothetical protein D3C81_1531970 [compost metagenome]
MGAHQTLRQTIAQPAAGAGDDAHIFGFQAHFFIQFAKQRIFRRFLRVDPALRELPGILVDAPRPHHLADLIGQNDADIRSEAIGIDHGRHLKSYMPGLFHKARHSGNARASAHGQSSQNGVR